VIRSVPGKHEEYTSEARINVRRSRDLETLFMILLPCMLVMAVPVRTYLNVGIRLLQIAFAGVVIAAAVSLQHVRSENEKFMNHPPTLHLVAAVSGLIAAGCLFSVSLTWYTCLVKYGRVVDLLGIMLNLAAGSVSV